MRELSTEIERLERAKDEAVSAQDFEKAAKLRDQAYQLKKKREEAKDKWRSEQSEKEQVGEVTAEVIAETVSKMTGIPLTRLEKAEAERLLQMEAELGGTVIHQDEAIKSIARAVRRSRSASRTRAGPWARSCSSARRASARRTCASSSRSSCSAARTPSSRWT
jgi:ATP-dependent Clp protease ATP-binding subunit ClpC